MAVQSGARVLAVHPDPRFTHWRQLLFSARSGNTQVGIYLGVGAVSGIGWRGVAGQAFASGCSVNSIERYKPVWRSLIAADNIAARQFQQHMRRLIEG